MVILFDLSNVISTELEGSSASYILGRIVSVVPFKAECFILHLSTFPIIPQNFLFCIQGKNTRTKSSR